MPNKNNRPAQRMADILNKKADTYRNGVRYHACDYGGFIARNGEIWHGETVHGLDGWYDGHGTPIQSTQPSRMLSKARHLLRVGSVKVGRLTVITGDSEPAYNDTPLHVDNPDGFGSSMEWVQDTGCIDDTPIHPATLDKLHDLQLAVQQLERMGA